jgi:hypothetical protein
MPGGVIEIAKGVSSQEFRDKTQVCGKCGEEKSVDQFRRGIKYPDDWCQRCRNRESSRKARKRKRTRSWGEIDIPDEKKCSSCGEVKPADKFYKNKKESHGLSYRCKTCIRGYQKDRHDDLADREWGEIDEPGEKQCTICEEVKSADRFYRRKKCVDGLSAHCKTCRRNKVNNEWRDNARHTAQQSKRRAQKQRAMPEWADEELIKKIYREAERMTEEQDEIYTVDHIDPLINDKVCGLHVVANLQILTLGENSKKNNNFELVSGNTPIRIPECVKSDRKFNLETALGR